MSFARFKRGDCDATGIARYNLGKERFTHRNGEIVTAQEALIKAGFLKPGTADGNAGRATLRAIEQWETSRDTDFYVAIFGTETEKAAVGEKKMIEDVPRHVSQWDFPEIEIVPGKSVRKIGCLSCCVEVINAYWKEEPPNIPGFVEAMVKRGGYDSAGNIQWAVVEELTGLNHTRDIGVVAAKALIDANEPTILCIRTRKGGTHFIVAVGYDGQGFHCHDVGSRRGDCEAYPNRTETPGQTYVRDEDVIRVDSLS